jgi:hypothetical protein
MCSDTKKCDRILGEGDNEAAREYEEATQELVQSGKLEEAARRAGWGQPLASSRAKAAM